LRPAAKTRTRIHSEEGRAGRGYDVHRERVLEGMSRTEAVIVPEGMLNQDGVGWLDMVTVLKKTEIFAFLRERNELDLLIIL